MHQPIDTARTASVPPKPSTELSAPAPPAAVAHAHAALPRVPHVPAAPPPPPPPPPPVATPAPAPAKVLTPAQVPTQPASRSAPVGRVGPVPRPMTVTLLAILWIAGVLYYPMSTIVAMRGAGSVLTAISATLGVLGTLISGILAWGLWSRHGWARIAQIAFAILGLLTCVFTPASAVILAYMFRTDVASHFSDRRPDGPGAGEDGRFEPYFAAAIGLLAGPPALLALILPFFLPAPAGL